MKSTLTSTMIQTEQLSKRYGSVQALESVSLAVQRGEIYAFLGLNGAGKTTLIRILLGLVRPDQGTAFLAGERVSPARFELWRRVGSLVEIPYAYPDLTVRENLEVLRRLRGLAPEAVERVIRLLHLEAYRDRKAQQLSLGNAQRLGLAKALIHQPDILILDEPSNGLDPAGMVEVRELLQNLACAGVTIFISSHLLGEMARIASRIGIIHQGRLLQEIQASELENLRQRRLLLDARDREGARRCLAERGVVLNPAREGGWETTDPEALEYPDRLAEWLVQGGHAPTLLQVKEEDLEQYFLRLIGQEQGRHRRPADVEQL